MKFTTAEAPNIVSRKSEIFYANQINATYSVTPETGKPTVNDSTATIETASVDLSSVSTYSHYAINQGYDDNYTSEIFEPTNATGTHDITVKIDDLKAGTKYAYKTKFKNNLTPVYSNVYEYSTSATYTPILLLPTTILKLILMQTLNK